MANFRNGSSELLDSNGTRVPQQTPHYVSLGGLCNIKVGKACVYVYHIVISHASTQRTTCSYLDSQIKTPSFINPHHNPWLYGLRKDQQCRFHISFEAKMQKMNDYTKSRVPFYSFSKRRISKGLHNLLRNCGRLARRTVGIQ